ncbi:Bifunctional solanapyrone synthase [Daldinia childiae]|uniref:Bifunctional solanapyrone synthase n=1 Tax=Daldinia childiae TaxID=326645 RepID=UPI001444D20B|nr:Bifunctional solanapyrone synthase [Daldinia childiae]KAF3067391.1 Bifunctional solanapyrone synthase [Daldinia childiae]
MRFFQVTIIATAIAVASLSTQQRVYSAIENIGEFLSRLDISQESRAEVSAILNSSYVSDNNAQLSLTDRADLACRVGGVVFGSSLYISSSTNYESLVDDNWSVTCWLTPQCILQPQSALDVSNAILISSFLGSQFSVRSGGHNPNIGFSSIGQEGMLIDLARLNEVTLSSDGKLAAIGPGNRWGRVYEILSSSGKMIVGGRANDIGVGGFFLGGGLSYWSSIYGMAFTKVVNYEVVLGDSSIVNANKSSNEDLFWALKGGGANFGIVTRFDVETVENGQIWFEGLLFDPSQHERLLQVTVDFAAAAEDDADASATYNLGPTGGAVYLGYNGLTERPEIFSDFYDIPHQSIINSTLGTWVDFHDAVSALNPFGSLRIAISDYDRKWDLKTLLDHYERYQTVSNDVQTRLNATLYFAPQIFGKSAVAVTSAQGGSPLGLSQDTHCLLEIMITWTDANYDEEAAQALLSLEDDITASGQQLGTDLKFHYMNDAGPNQDVLGSYGSLERMRSVTSRIPAAAYVCLSSAEEVAKALSVIRSTGSKFAIRSAGHNANPGFSSVGSSEAGIVLDLRGLNSKALDEETNIIRMGSGNTWSETFTWLEKKNLSVVGAREGQVGLSGFLLGGGQGVFSSLYGLGVDNVKNFEVVLADGTIVNSNAETYPDLYFVLKGGGSNFGIVTGVSLQAYPLIKVQYTINMYDPSDYENVLNAFAKVQESMEKDPKIGMFINTRRDFIAVGLFYADWPAEFPGAFDPIVKLTSFLGAAVPTSNGTFSTLAEILQEWAYKEKDMKHAYATMTTKISCELYEKGHRLWKDIVEKLPRTVDLHWTIQPLTQEAVRAGEDRGGNVLGLEKVPQSCKLTVLGWIFACDWKQDQDDEAVRNALDLVLQRVEKIAVDSGLLLELRFPTFAGASQNVLASFGAENVKKLHEAASRYDPDRVFQELQNGGFLIRDI